MIPSDHFVRFYNEVFKALQRRGHEHLVEYWRELGKLQTKELGERFRLGGIKAAQEYWQRIVVEENCEATLTSSEGRFDFIMHRCPSLSKAMDNDAEPSTLYCDHCMAWIEPVLEHAGMHGVFDIESRTEPHCTFRLFTNRVSAEEFEKKAKLLAKPYAGEPKLEATPKPNTSGAKPKA